MEDVLGARRELERPLRGFRLAVSEFSGQVASAAWEPGFAAEADTLFREKVEPEVAGIEEALRENSSLRELAWRTARHGAIPETIGALFGSADALAGLAGAALGLGYGAARSLLDRRETGKEVEGNRLYFYCRAGKMLERGACGVATARGRVARLGLAQWALRTSNGAGGARPPLAVCAEEVQLGRGCIAVSSARALRWRTEFPFRYRDPHLAFLGFGDQDSDRNSKRKGCSATSLSRGRRLRHPGRRVVALVDQDAHFPRSLPDDFLESSLRPYLGSRDHSGKIVR